MNRNILQSQDKDAAVWALMTQSQSNGLTWPETSSQHCPRQLLLPGRPHPGDQTATRQDPGEVKPLSCTPQELPPVFVTQRLKKGKGSAPERVGSQQVSSSPEIRFLCPLECSLPKGSLRAPNNFFPTD